ncbi:MAG: hypothetical protein J7598_19825 [Mitsuaria chitosanitabida]|uniref:hypothetical protein n=1 Tax=Roseateles chitosanitabidus TaxID=65048 RepID=UPI001AFEFF8F|nr:hypothetical protein [Roseateles chitosanitabidus]MBO9688857.1 hypothetical protein [Roseateles chitosanitabidus]
MTASDRHSTAVDIASPPMSLGTLAMASASTASPLANTFGAAPRRGRGVVITAVVALHVLLGLWLQSSWHRGVPHDDQRRSSIRMVTIQLPPLPKEAAPRTEAKRAVTAKATPAPSSSTNTDPREEATPRHHAPIAIPPDEPRTTLVQPSPETQVATSPPPAASGPSGRDLMYGAATQRAIRQGTQGQPLLSERADQANQAPERVEASAKLGKEIMKGATTDCLKGEFAGAGMGLLSAPFLLLAEARGKCRR